ncbi:MAG: glycosyltransferase [Xanthobacteraceae bacterium]
MTLDIVIFGLSITSSWGNGHATTYRALIKALAARGHKVTFVERDVPWYREHRDLRHPGYCTVELYRSLKEVPRRFGRLVADADLVILGSYVPDGAVLGDWLTMNARGVTAFYDIDTPVTLMKLTTNAADYIHAALVPRFDLYLSFTGGPTLEFVEEMYGSPRARPLYCSVDPEVHTPAAARAKWSLGYLGTYSADRQPKLERLLIEPARYLPTDSFAVVGPQYPAGIAWPANVERRDHLAPAAHPAFYGSQRFALNITRADMAAAGFSPSVRLFEAAACGAPVISDRWPGIETIFVPGEEILIADVPEHVVNALSELPEERRLSIAAAARKRVLSSHTSEHRAKQLEGYYCEVLDSVTPKIRTEAVA